MMKEQQFDAIVSDYQMPECNGLRFLWHCQLGTVQGPCPAPGWVPVSRHHPWIPGTVQG
jgi:DNA-binding NarL/FixJ family response regulator